MAVEKLQSSGDVSLQWTTDQCNAVILESKILNDWKKGWIVNIYKGKGDVLECGSLVLTEV